MAKSKTRKQRAGGKLTNTNKQRIISGVQKKEQIIHCISQLKRFTKCFQAGDMGRLLQFGYNLGRLQELCGETTHPELWWKPFETMIQAKEWEQVHAYLDELQGALQISYDTKVVESGC